MFISLKCVHAPARQTLAKRIIRGNFQDVAAVLLLAVALVPGVVVVGVVGPVLVHLCRVRVGPLLGTAAIVLAHRHGLASRPRPFSTSAISDILDTVGFAVLIRVTSNLDRFLSIWQTLFPLLHVVVVGAQPEAVGLPFPGGLGHVDPGGGLDDHGLALLRAVVLEDVRDLVVQQALLPGPFAWTFIVLIPSSKGLADEAAFQNIIFIVRYLNIQIYVKV